jgi:hypothetical protein
MRTKIINKKGKFWLGGQEQEPVSGELTIEDGGIITLNLFGILHEGLKVDKYFDVLGMLEGNANVTLQGCHYMRRTLFNEGIPTANIKSEKAIFGAHFIGEEPLFNEISFSTDCLIEWLELSSIKVIFEEEQALVTVRQLAPIEHKLENGDLISIYFGTEGPRQPVSNALKILQTAYIRYTSSNSLPLDNLLEKAESIRDFIVLGVDQSLCLSNVIVHSPETQDIFLYQGLKVFYRDSNFKNLLPKIRQDQMLFTYQSIKSKFATVLSSWLAFYTANVDVMGLYFSVQSGKALDDEMELLHYAQGLESLHRNVFESNTYISASEYSELLTKINEACPIAHRDWLSNKLAYANEPPFSKRVKELVKKCSLYLGNSKQRKYMAENIFNCRNLLTHQGKNKIAKCLKGQTMTDLRQTTRLLYQLLFMELVGFSKEEIDHAIKRNDRCKLVLKDALPLCK